MTDEQPRAKPPNFLEVHADNHPDKVAVIGLERSLTYGQLRERARALAKSLYGLGVRPGDQVALMTYNDPVHTEVANALQYLEVGLVMVGYRMKPREIEYIVDNSDSRVLIFWHEFAHRILPHKENYTKILPGGFVSFGGPQTSGARDFEALIQDAPDMDLDVLPPATEPGSSMIYTSGTTGRPKGAARRTDFVAKPGVMDFMFSTISTLKMDPKRGTPRVLPPLPLRPYPFQHGQFLAGRNLGHAASVRRGGVPGNGR